MYYIAVSQLAVWASVVKDGVPVGSPESDGGGAGL